MVGSQVAVDRCWWYTTCDYGTYGDGNYLRGANVTVRASCTVTMADLGIPGLPGSRTITAEATSAVDRFRTR